MVLDSTRGKLSVAELPIYTDGQIVSDAYTLICVAQGPEETQSRQTEDAMGFPRMKKEVYGPVLSKFYEKRVSEGWWSFARQG